MKNTDNLEDMLDMEDFSGLEDLGDLENYVDLGDLADADDLSDLASLLGEEADAVPGDEAFLPEEVDFSGIEGLPEEADAPDGGELPDEEDFWGLKDLSDYEIPESSETMPVLETETAPKPSRLPERKPRKEKAPAPRKEAPKKDRQKNRSPAGLLAVVLVLLLGLIALVICTKFYAVVDWHLYPRNRTVLDLREKEISAERYEAVREALPESEILWSVPFQGSTVSSDVRELTVTQLNEADAAALEYFPNLTTLHAEGCEDYARLASFQLAHPDCRVLYRMEISGTTYDQDAQVVTLTSLTPADMERLACLAKLKTVIADLCGEYDLLAQLRAEHPDWEVRYTVPLGDAQLSPDTVEAEVTGADSAELIAGLPGLPELKTLTLVDPKADGATLLALRQQYPELELSWYFVIGGEVVPETAAEVDVSNMDFASLEEAENMASCFPGLQKFIMSWCTVNGEAIDNEDMAAFRERVRDQYKVVWTVECGTLTVRTDDTTFMPTREGEYYFKDNMSYNLRYCEDMICIDVGHHPVKDISFVSYMPHLKYLILTDTAVQDISPLENAKELIFLELTFGIVRDYSPLLGCTALEDLEMSHLWYHADATPLYQMTWLKNLFWNGCSGQVAVKLQASLTETRLDFTGATTNSAGTGWRNLQNYYDMRDILGMPYMN